MKMCESILHLAQLSKQKLKLGTFTFDVEYNANTG
jgi:hypothetical protein